VTWQRHVFSTMGTVVSLTYDGARDADLGGLEETFACYDSRFSLYRPDSELSRIRAGELSLAESSDQLREVYSIALEWRESTHGEFTPHRPDGVIDLSGVVKALAMKEAGIGLVSHGAIDWCLNVGGDVLVAGLDQTRDAWSIGIVDPLDRNALLTAASLRGSRRACATSGSAERGDHIWTIGAAPVVFVQATVLADDIVTADVLATTIIAGGPAALDQICATWDVDVLTIDRAGELRITPGFTTRIPSEH
jgi:thiamine biosynthesis lipoprotein